MSANLESTRTEVEEEVFWLIEEQVEVGEVLTGLLRLKEEVGEDFQMLSLIHI